MTAYNPAEVARLIAEAREDDANLLADCAASRPDATGAMARMCRNARAMADQLEAAQAEIGEVQVNDSCPCAHIAPCDERCTCVNPMSSSGCRRCCLYGSDEQQRAAAERLAALADHYELCALAYKRNATRQLSGDVAALPGANVRAVVRGAIHTSVGGEIGEMGSARIDHETVTAIADRVAAQIPTPPTKSDQLQANRDDPKRAQDVVREILVVFLASDGPVTTAEEIDAIADRVAAGLAARAVDRAADEDDPDYFIT